MNAYGADRGDRAQHAATDAVLENRADETADHVYTSSLQRQRIVHAQAMRRPAGGRSFYEDADDGCAQDAHLKASDREDAAPGEEIASLTMRRSSQQLGLLPPHGLDSPCGPSGSDRSAIMISRSRVSVATSSDSGGNVSPTLNPPRPTAPRPLLPRELRRERDAEEGHRSDDAGRGDRGGADGARRQRQDARGGSDGAEGDALGDYVCRGGHTCKRRRLRGKQPGANPPLPRAALAGAADATWATCGARARADDADVHSGAGAASNSGVFGPGIGPSRFAHCATAEQGLLRAVHRDGPGLAVGSGELPCRGLTSGGRPPDASG